MSNHRVTTYLQQNSAKIELAAKVVSVVAVAASVGYFAGRFSVPPTIRPVVNITKEAVDQMYRVQNLTTA